MIIVSQNKRVIINFENIKTIELDRETNFTSITIFRETNETETGLCGLYLGHYKTEERAKEVLEEIKESYKNWNNLIYGQSSVHCNPIYEMPKD